MLSPGASYVVTSALGVYVDLHAAPPRLSGPARAFWTTLATTEKLL